MVRSFAEATMIDPSTGPEAEERAYEEAAIEDSMAGGTVGEDQPVAEPADDDRIAAHQPVTLEVPDQGSRLHAETRTDDDFSPFADRDYVETPRRGPLFNILILLVIVAALAAAFWFFAPLEWKARLGLADASATPLELSNPPHMRTNPAR